MLTGISEIDAHPKDVARWKPHILWMRSNVVPNQFRRVRALFSRDSGEQRDEGDRHLGWRRWNATNQGGGPRP